VIERGREVTIVKRRTDWFELRTDRGVQGWAPRGADDRDARADRRAARPAGAGARELYESALAGRRGGRRLLRRQHDLDVRRLRLQRQPVDRADAQSHHRRVLQRLQRHARPDARVRAEWRISPYFTLGTGWIHTEPKSTLVQSIDRDDQIGYVGGGLQFYLTRRFMLRSEYRKDVIFTSRDDNEEVDEWKYLGFAFFF
jgi:opacity protein-like surface antigen